MAHTNGVAYQLGKEWQYTIILTTAIFVHPKITGVNTVKCHDSYSLMLSKEIFFSSIQKLSDQLLFTKH